MKANLTYEKVKINKIIFNKTLEESIDFSYQLPDYYTGIFKVLQFELEPNISSCRASNKQFIIDGIARMKLIYIDEEEGDVKAIHQNIPFSKTIDLEEDITDAVIFYDVKTTYKNCKIISPKKINIKANFSIPLKVQIQKEEDILTSTNEKDLQLKFLPVKITSQQIWTTQQFNINEQIELSNICKEILDIKIKIIDEECKIIANKIIAKSIANIEILYCGETKNSPIFEKSSISINNIIDMQGINDKFLYNLKYNVTSINFETLKEGKVLNIKADVLIDSLASIPKEINIVSDAFSTKFETEFETKEFNSVAIISTINEKIEIEKKIENVKIDEFFDADINISDLNHMQGNDEIDFKAKLNLNILGRNKDQTLESITKSIPIEFKIKNKDVIYDYTKININDISILKTKFEKKENSELLFKIEFNIKGFIYTSGNLTTIKNIIIDEKKIKPKSKAALTLYYPKLGDKIWNIAKNFCTSPLAIAEANNLKSDVIEKETMLIIPII